MKSTDAALALRRLGKRLARWEEELSLPDGFLSQLLDADDWSFVIKAHALLEAAITRALTAEVNRPELRRLFARLNMSSEPVGKAAAARALSLITKGEQRFIIAMSHLRNALAHDVTQTAFSFDTAFRAGVDFSVGRWRDFALAFVERRGNLPVAPTPRMLKFFLWNECTRVVSHLSHAGAPAAPSVDSSDTNLEGFMDTFEKHTANEARRAAHEAARERAKAHYTTKPGYAPHMVPNVGDLTAVGDHWSVGAFHAPDLEERLASLRADPDVLSAQIVPLEGINSCRVDVRFRQVIHRRELSDILGRTRAPVSHDTRRWHPAEEPSS